MATAAASSETAAARLRAEVSTMLHPYGMSLFDSMTKYRTDKVSNINKTTPDTTDQLKYIPMAKDKSKTFRAYYQAAVLGTNKFKRSIIDENVRAFNSAHLVPVTYSIENNPTLYSGHAFVTGLDKAPLTTENMHLVPRGDLSRVHHSDMDLTQFYKIDDLNGIPMVKGEHGANLLMCDMRYVVDHAIAQAQKKINKETAVVTGAAPRQRKTQLNARITTALKKSHARQDLALEFIRDNNVARGSLPLLVLSDDEVAMTNVRRLLAHQYVPLSRSDHERYSLPTDYVVEYEAIAKLAENLLTCETGPRTPMVDTLPLIQAMFLTQTIGAEQAFWNHMRNKSIDLIPTDAVEASVQVADTDPASRHDATMIGDAILHAHIIYNELGRAKSSLLATMQPLAVAVRLATNVGSCKQVAFEQRKSVTCALSGGMNEAHENMWCVQCPLNPLATGGNEPGFVIFFVRATLLTSLRDMLDGVTCEEEPVPPPAPADDPMEIDGWEAPVPVPEVRVRACPTHFVSLAHRSP